ncbi:hypothetical protein [Deinococcus ruber]|uniref:Uncharacterized protein n=1 Tax=Deinococcus ruber TaxID=1848197 RepID=A0A918C1K7_9DEIO|nr:hypothetical protein [Deinococcus ruber]GGR00092.1 hypothetical protein GCM10008957_10990 [Deinococcus ruber]
MIADDCRDCGNQLDEFGACMTCDTYGTPADRRAEKTQEVLDLIAAERARQDKKWGQQNHGPLYWLAILGEEFGEVSKEVVEWEAHRQRVYARAIEAGMADSLPELEAEALSSIHLVNLRNELIQTAAVAVGILESLERNQGVAL